MVEIFGWDVCGDLDIEVLLTARDPDSLQVADISQGRTAGAKTAEIPGGQMTGNQETQLGREISQTWHFLQFIITPQSSTPVIIDEGRYCVSGRSMSRGGWLWFVVCGLLNIVTAVD